MRGGRIAPETVVIPRAGAVLLRPEGTGDFCSADGDGCPVLVEWGDRGPRVIVWADINQEDPTVGCARCGALVDERECIPAPGDDGGDLCAACQ